MKRTASEETGSLPVVDMGMGGGKGELERSDGGSHWLAPVSAHVRAPTITSVVTSLRRGVVPVVGHVLSFDSASQRAPRGPAFTRMHVTVTKMYGSQTIA